MLDQETSPQTHAIIGAMLEVHKELGCGFQERVYQEALAIEFALRGIPFEQEQGLPLTYKGRLLRSTSRPDFICCGSVVLELKALAHLGPIEEAQVIHYLRASGFKVGLLANFGARSLEWRRFVNERPPRSAPSAKSAA